jgi:hypothetical protein
MPDFSFLRITAEEEWKIGMAGHKDSILLPKI